MFDGTHAVPSSEKREMRYSIVVVFPEPLAPTAAMTKTVRYTLRLDFKVVGL